MPDPTHLVISLDCSDAIPIESITARLEARGRVSEIEQIAVASPTAFYIISCMSGSIVFLENWPTYDFI